MACIAWSAFHGKNSKYLLGNPVHARNESSSSVIRASYNWLNAVLRDEPTKRVSTEVRTFINHIITQLSELNQACPDVEEGALI